MNFQGDLKPGQLRGHEQEIDRDRLLHHEPEERDPVPSGPVPEFVVFYQAEGFRIVVPGIGSGS